MLGTDGKGRMGREKRMAVAGGVPPPTFSRCSPSHVNQIEKLHHSSLLSLPCRHRTRSRVPGWRRPAVLESSTLSLLSSPLLLLSGPPLSLSHTHVGENGRIRPGPSHGPLSPPADLRRLSCHYWAPLPPANGPPPVSNCVPFPIAGACQTVLIRRRKP